MVPDKTASLMDQHQQPDGVWEVALPKSTPFESIDVAMNLLRRLLTPDLDTDRNPLGECPECLKAICARFDANAAASERTHCATCDRRTAAALNGQRPVRREQ